MGLAGRLRCSLPPFVFPLRHDIEFVVHYTPHSLEQFSLYPPTYSLLICHTVILLLMIYLVMRLIVCSINYILPSQLLLLEESFDMIEFVSSCPALPAASNCLRLIQSQPSVQPNLIDRVTNSRASRSWRAKQILFQSLDMKCNRFRDLYPPICPNVV
ncbi:uncharacterized protein EDB91DRAFT_495753 [Suillus paluster]|uniref:uncharacterized protein n=1 Tax=Suillus paluster TaxID=48578 RepID=UPI001B873028|nr:uncharacterized protein EDB91DRAFT_495753 [Suillus paluster]KAG1736887.1 hypothetical protein EDB91DRAFT_495753 [Suillus paluster]